MHARSPITTRNSLPSPKQGGTAEQIEVKVLADTPAGQESLRAQFCAFDIYKFYKPRTFILDLICSHRGFNRLGF